jgi:hypothetical protein
LRDSTVNVPSGDNRLLLIIPYSVLHLFGAANAVINPFLYGYLNETFRNEYKNLYRQLPWYSSRNSLISAQIIPEEENVPLQDLPVGLQLEKSESILNIRKEVGVQVSTMIIIVYVSILPPFPNN